MIATDSQCTLDASAWPLILNPRTPGKAGAILAVLPNPAITGDAVPGSEDEQRANAKRLKVAWNHLQSMTALLAEFDLLLQDPETRPPDKELRGINAVSLAVPLELLKKTRHELQLLEADMQ